MKKSLLLGALASLSLAVPAVAHAGGPPIVNETTTSAASLTVPFGGPCTPPGMVSIEYRQTIHVTDLGGGRFIEKFNEAGSFFFEPDDGSATSSGRYRNGYTTVGTSNTFNDTSNFVVRGRNEDGDRVAFKIHTVFSVSNGEVHVEIVDIACG